MLTDKQGNNHSGASAFAVERYDQAVRAFNIYHGDPVALLDEAIEAEPAFASGYIAKAHLFASTSEPALMQEIGPFLESARALPLNDRERSHIAALELLVAGEWSRAGQALDQHNMQYPHDLLALQSGHLIDFFCANSRNLRDRLARVLPDWSPDIPGYAVLLGMYAFGLEECGDFARAEDTGRRALSMEPLDCWAHHAVAHVMEMQGRPEDGIGWMISREIHWSGDENQFKVHNWWHRTLFHLELVQNAEALALYDSQLRGERSNAALNLIDASAMLWRLHLTGIEVGNRWTELADAWQQHADGKTYPFNDWHAVMAFLGAGRGREIERVLAALRASASASTEAGRWAGAYAVPLIEGFVAFWRDNHAVSVDRLLKARSIVNAFGGSHAQRDVIDWTLREAAARGGLSNVSRALIHERFAHKPHSPLTNDWLERSTGQDNADVRAARRSIA